MKFKKLLLAAVVSVSSSMALANAQLDPNLPDYNKVSGVSGKLVSVGSDTLANMMSFWTEEFKKLYPNVTTEVQAAGSSTAPPALTEGASNIGPMSRKMKSKEIEAFEKRFGYKPTAVAVAIDALAVFVHKDNPVEGLTVPQVDAIFSSTRKCGSDEKINSWGDLGLSGSWSSRSIQLYGRNSVSGTYGYFKKKALCKGDFRSTVNEQPGSASVVQAVGSSLNGIGYSGVGYKTSGVRAVPLSKKGSDFIEASAENALKGTYPLARKLYVYINKAPNKSLSPLEKESIRMMLSKTGQEVLVKDGYIPLPAKLVSKQLKALGI